jgi:hypothetical protein
MLAALRFTKQFFNASKAKANDELKLVTSKSDALNHHKTNG